VKFPGKYSLNSLIPSTFFHLNSMTLKTLGRRKAKLMEQSIEVATEPLQAEIIEHRQTKGRQNQNTQKQVLITKNTESIEVVWFR
jgi:hypothetical protein